MPLCLPPGTADICPRFLPFGIISTWIIHLWKHSISQKVQMFWQMITILPFAPPLHLNQHKVNPQISMICLFYSRHTSFSPFSIFVDCARQVGHKGKVVVVWRPLRLEWTQFSLFHSWCPPIKQRKAPNIQMQRKGETRYLQKRRAFSKVGKLKQLFEAEREECGGTGHSLWKSNRIKRVQTM